MKQPVTKIGRFLWFVATFCNRQYFVLVFNPYGISWVTQYFPIIDVIRTTPVEPLYFTRGHSGFGENRSRCDCTSIDHSTKIH